VQQFQEFLDRKQQEHQGPQQQQGVQEQQRQQPEQELDSSDEEIQTAQVTGVSYD